MRQELVGKNVERTKQVSYEHYDILLRNKLKFLLTQFALGSEHQMQYLVWFPSGDLVL